ncbi:rhodanese-like domain-containing protein [Trichothermofontia sp.]
MTAMTVPNADAAITQISAEELATYLAGADPATWQLIDVREPHEWDIVHLDGFELLPLSQFEAWSGQISQRFDRHRETIVLCHHGMRSQRLCEWLVSQGFEHVKNVVGGIDAYAIQVDPSLRQY